MVGSEAPKIRETSLRGIPRSQAASILSLRSFEYGFMPAVLHADQSLRKSLHDLREALTETVARARQAQLGVWAEDRTNAGFEVEGLHSITDEHVILPKLFRRLAEY